MTSSEKPFMFQGQGQHNPEQQAFWQNLTRLPLPQMDDPARYYSEDDGLMAAVNTALSLGMPLLLTGAPGVGKTQLAYRIAYELGCEPIFFPVKSDSEAQDLFYQIDYLRRLHVAQLTPQTASADAVDLRKFIRFQGLGLAILRAMPESTLERLGLHELAWPDQAQPLPRQPSVVLIDEIDKAPGDFPNDLLEQIRRMRFDVPDLNTGTLSIYADPDNPQQEEQRYRPVIVITSNSEKTLPEPFLRRCVYYHMHSPDQTTLEIIINQRLAEHSGLKPELQRQCLSFFIYLRDQATLEKKPSTGELLSWLLALSKAGLAPLTAAPPAKDPWLRLAEHCLLKQKPDQEKIAELIELWWEQYQAK